MDKTVPLTRFAPSPTGHLHLGNARVALANWLEADRKNGGMILRLDDTDSERSTAEYSASILEDLKWLGLSWSAQFSQSDRIKLYSEAAQRLKESGRLYPCYETPEELDLKRKSQLSAGKPPVYDRAGLKLDQRERSALASDGRKPHWRFRLADEPMEWVDGVRGLVRFEAGSMSDPVLIRADGRPLYTLASVVDDIDLGISHVIRGEDHVANTATQREIFAALEAPSPIFSHLSLLVDSKGQNLAKRTGGLSVHSFREAGIESMSLNSLLARLGTSKSVVARHSLAAVRENFDLADFNRTPASFNPDDLVKLTRKVLKGLQYCEVKSRLVEFGLNEVNEAFWVAIRGNIDKFSDIGIWWGVIKGPKKPIIEDAMFAAKAADLLPDGDWDHTTWKSWTSRIKMATGTEGPSLFKPLRLALTGMDHGPELKVLLPLIGRPRAKARLMGKTA